MDSTSVSLLRRLREPQADSAWRRFVDLYAPLIFHWGCQKGLNETDAADLVHRTLLLLQAEFRETTWQAAWQQLILGHAASDVAKQFNLSINAVYLAKSRLLARLREELEGLLD